MTKEPLRLHECVIVHSRRLVSRVCHCKLRCVHAPSFLDELRRRLDQLSRHAWVVCILEQQRGRQVGQFEVDLWLSVKLLQAVSRVHQAIARIVV